MLGLFFACVGLLLLLVVIPRQTEVIDYGWMRPQSLPNAAAIVIAAAGAVLAFRPRGAIDFDWRKAGRAALYLVLVAAGVWLIALFGFEVVAPLIAMAVMLMAGERRPAWLALGTVGIPFVIWLAATVLLDRPLP
ncbi:MAG: tripartite tricarboxylate transporter TctB family protein [Gammaproteobacteria bacterium]|nr:tripartite tricarboxylate transporter TctB family protein [Gammaproteobacteria bacterium]